MRCASCGTELIPGKRFCHACGARATSQCPACGASVTAEFRFCPDCGVELASAGVHDVPPATDDRLARMAGQIPEGLAHKIRAAQETIAGERKQVTVLFCDLAGSTAIAERLDPEEYAELLDQYLELSFREIYRLEGIVTYSAGDGLMALFGAPVAHEDAPQRAIRAALAIRTALSKLDARLRSRHGVELRARIGIHTGPVVVGTVGNDMKMDYTAIGDTTNLAARLEALAAPGTVFISEATHRLVRGFFDVKPTGPLDVKGKREPVSAFEVVGPMHETSPMPIAAERGLTPLVGREAELAQLEACLRRVTVDRAQVVSVVGDAGSGKSRLLYELKRRLANEPVVFFEGRCSSMSHAVPYHPFLSMLRRYFDLAPGDSPEVACQKVSDTLGVAFENLGQSYPLMSRFLSLIPDPGGEMPAEEFKRESFNAIARLLLGETEEAPVVMLLEDLQWIDDASLELFESLVARLSTARVMVVVSHRPEGRPRWQPPAAYTQLVLEHLSDEHVTDIIRSVVGGALPAELESLLT